MYTMSNIKNLSLKIVSAEKNTITANQTTAFQKYPYVKIVFINSGEGLLTFKDTSEKIGPNQIVLLNPNIDYYWELSSNQSLEITEIGVHGLEFSHIGEAEHEFTYYKYDKTDTDSSLFTELLLKELTAKKPGSEEIAKRYIEIILIQLLRNEEFSIRNSLNKKNHKEIQTVKNFMKVNYHKNITLDDLVELVHINKFYLIRIFKQEVGMSPIDYLIHIRIDEAQKMLRNTNIAIADIAHLVGFQSPSHFSKTFRELSNITPSQYRRQGNMPPTPPQG
ncbi:AraC family transcriptional regulator [Jeotgalibaca ciconiae]|uniref:AraC family transcriptional regulator n=1 Tax=Jeotgalibaca ciconiae TaxID=2496265 RepID=A0A3S9HAP3_9LACT|nr:AraC family transcriptional regulator [Jeotgalibaca ciconiae]AZP04452.1 AraC family transcriptional regulator [Jeotgalibaca ciconiae]HJB23567.1 AraC family transcriptional regulator [Candidatus Jeotgalibaca pullicola]